MNTRLLKDEDWDTLCKWWDAWPDWVNPPKSLLPDNGKGGLMVEKEGKPIVAGFIYLTNSKTCLLEWVISDPEYRGKDRRKAIELLITSAEEACKKLGNLHMFSICRNRHLMETHKNLGWHADKKPSYELIKNI